MTGLIRYSPVPSLRRLSREVDDFWGRFFGTDLPAAWYGDSEFMPAFDVKETDYGLEVSADVPGMGKDDIKVNFSGDILTVSGERKEEHEDDKGSYHVCERSYGSFSRSLRVPFEVDREKMEAHHKDGVLKIKLFRSAAEAPTSIEVKEG